jgi:hypothetical protein
MWYFKARYPKYSKTSEIRFPGKRIQRETHSKAGRRLISVDVQNIPKIPVQHL